MPCTGSEHDTVGDFAANDAQDDLAHSGLTAEVVPIAGVISGTDNSSTLAIAAQAGSLLRYSDPDILHADGHVVFISGAPQASVPTSSTRASSDHEPVTPVKGETANVLESPLSDAGLSLGSAATSRLVSVEELRGGTITLLRTQFRAFVVASASKIPIAGSYIVRKYAPEDASTTVAITEATPLLAAVRDPEAFATQQVQGLILRVLSPFINRLPDIEALDNSDDGNRGLLFEVLVEIYVLMKNGGGWFFTHIQEHSLVVAPTVSLGHLSTTDLAASTIGTAVASVTGYSVIQGFISALDELLASASNHRIEKMWCARTALITGIALFPIMNVWTLYATSLLVRLGQSPEVAQLAGQFLRVMATGLPAYAIGEIAKRYLTSQGLSKVHTRILSVTAPLNMILNYLLVNGPIPAIRLGFAGAPLCTALSHNVIAGVLIIYIVQRAVHEEVDHLRGQDHLHDEGTVDMNSEDDSGPSSGTHTHEAPRQQTEETSFFAGMGELAWSGIAGVGKSAAQLWSKDFGGLVASILGPGALATQAILLATTSTLYQVPRALSSASSERMRKWVARGETQRAKIAASVAFVGTLGVVIVMSLILLAFASSWGALFNNDPLVLQTVCSILPIIAIFQAVYGIGAWVDGSLAALGKTAVFPALNASADYFVGIPLGLYLAFPRHWGLAGLWAGLIVSLTYSCVVAVTVLVSTDWKKAAKGKKEQDRARDEGGQETGLSVA
ncbi:hypothetical protein F5I97DRAFT_1878769 [Phlebopus sp. FC_14]|nr:hypothetical protein F5I97DRAFT_1878769 [Phlebopus sp. FC_14]